MSPPAESLPLAGVRVVDVSSVVMGPLATQILADLGADVIVVERPEGDANRCMGVGPHPELSGPALNLMRNKRSIVLDIGRAEGHEVLLDIVRSADVFVTNIRPGARARACLTYEHLSTVRPGLVFCAASGYPPGDPRADDAAYDDIIQSACGFVDLHRRAGMSAVLAPTILVDKVAGMAIANAITAALFRRERTGEGSEISLAMNKVAMSFLLVEHGAGAIPEPPTGDPGYQRVLQAERRPLATSDGLVTVVAYERHQFEGLVRIGGRGDLAVDDRFRTRLGRLDHLVELYGEYQTIAARFDTETFLAMCRDHGVPAHCVVGLDEIVAALPLADHPVAGKYRFVPPLVPAGGDTPPPSRPAPLIGQHGHSILASLGWTNDAIDSLIDRGIVGGSTEGGAAP